MIMAVSNFIVGSTYSFTTLAPSVLGGSFTNAQVIGIVNYGIALAITNIATLQKTVFPLLPPGSPSNYEDYNYIVFSTGTNSKLVLADAWINQGSIVQITGTAINITINNASLADVAILQKELTAMGYTNFAISTSNGSSGATGAVG
jgi:hypothetical protein